MPPIRPFHSLGGDPEVVYLTEESLLRFERAEGNTSPTVIFVESRRTPNACETYSDRECPVCLRFRERLCEACPACENCDETRDPCENDQGPCGDRTSDECGECTLVPEDQQGHHNTCFNTSTCPACLACDYHDWRDPCDTCSRCENCDYCNGCDGPDEDDCADCGDFADNGSSRNRSSRATNNTEVEFLDADEINNLTRLDWNVLSQDCGYGEFHPRPAKTPEEGVLNLGLILQHFKDLTYRDYGKVAIMSGGCGKVRETTGGHIHISWLIPQKEIRAVPNNTHHDFVVNVLALGAPMEEATSSSAQIRYKYIYYLFSCLDFLVGIPLSRAPNGLRRNDCGYGVPFVTEIRCYGNRRSGMMDCSSYGVEYRTPPSFVSTPRLYGTVLKTVACILNCCTKEGLLELLTRLNPTPEYGTDVLSLKQYVAGYQQPNCYRPWREATLEDYLSINLPEEDARFMIDVRHNSGIPLKVDINAWLEYMITRRY